MDFSFGTNTVSSLAEALAECVGEVDFVPPEHLPLWLPDLRVPRLWEATIPSGTVTRMLRRRIRSEEHWDACEVINLFRVSGPIPEPLVHEQIARTLRDSGAQAIESHRIDVAVRYNVIAAQASGLLSTRDGVLHSQYTDYAVNAAAGGALIEQIILVVGEALPLLEDELATLTTGLRRALLASIDRASPAGARSPIPTSHPSLGEP
ncbi:hypothetical protein [Mycolicibacterium sp. CH28]|uniref:hypothetical protein n=1 Tax=Mycolicibacterium sp. CH28 TaxID=2512237 RepID=UPI001F2C87E7|nr:hypothetical protein [Mycolicibacterium sp. CH28]